MVVRWYLSANWKDTRASSDFPVLPLICAETTRSDEDLVEVLMVVIVGVRLANYLMCYSTKSSHRHAMTATFCLQPEKEAVYMAVAASGKLL